MNTQKILQKGGIHIKAVIMAGGFGTRLRPVTGDKPKPMADILGKPIMEHIVARLRACGFDEICAALKYRAGDIIAHFGDGARFGVQMQYRIEDEPLGTAGAVKNCADFYGDEDFLVISADAACDFELDKLMAAHKSSGAAVSIALYRNPEPLRFGLALRDNAGLVRAFIEKPDWPHVVTDMVNTGVYVISPRIMELVPEGAEYDFGRQLFPELLRRGEKILGLEMEGYWRDMGSPGDYYRCCADAWENRWKINPSSDLAALGHLPPVGEGFPLGGSCRAATDEGINTLIPVSDRAGLMAILSGELMELGADYSEGLSLETPSFEISIRPAAEISALRVAVRSEDAELAEDIVSLARDMIEKLEK